MCQGSWVNFIGGYSAGKQGMTRQEPLIAPSAGSGGLGVSPSSVNVGSTKTGINMDAVKLMGEIVLATAEATKEQDSLKTCQTCGILQRTG